MVGEIVVESKHHMNTAPPRTAVIITITITVATGVCKINAQSENTGYDSQPPFPVRSMLTKWQFEWIGVQNKRPIILNGFGAFLSTLISLSLSLYMYIYVYMYTYIYIYIEREREERVFFSHLCRLCVCLYEVRGDGGEADVTMLHECICIHVTIHTCICVHAYVHMRICTCIS